MLASVNSRHSLGKWQQHPKCSRALTQDLVLILLRSVAEITPVRWRGVSLSIVTFTILPFIPVVLYVQLLYLHSTWRWGLAVCAIWNFLGFLGLFFCYKPPARHNTDGMTAMQIAKRIDWMGAFLTIAGVTLFLVGLQAGGYQYPWTTGKVLAPLIIGAILILLFPVWEVFGAKHPMVPRAIFQGQRVVALGFIVVFIGGESLTITRSTLSRAQRLTFW